jgi:hypothetical protein
MMILTRRPTGLAAPTSALSSFPLATKSLTPLPVTNA